jgi:dTMP kinase
MPATSPSDPRAIPRFLVVEGVDGSGKSTQVQLLASWLQEHGLPVLVTREPGGTPLAERLRALILDPSLACAPRAELLLLLAARAQHVAERIGPAIAAGTTVIADRFSLSTLVYQGIGRGLPLDEIRTADRMATGGLTPDLTLVIDVPLEVVLARIGARTDRFEGEGAEFLARIIAGYRQLSATEPGVVRLDGTPAVPAVHAALQTAVRARLGGLTRGHAANT